MLWVFAQIEVTPSNAGLPGAVFWQQVLGWLAWAGLAGSLASLLFGGGVWGLSPANGNAFGAPKGQLFALRGLARAILLGLSATVVDTPPRTAPGSALLLALLHRRNI